MYNECFIQYVRHKLKSILWDIIKKADDYMGQKDCLQRILEVPYEDFPLVITDIPNSPDAPISYIELCHGFLDLRHKYKTLSRDIILNLPESKSILEQFIQVFMDSGDICWDFVEENGTHLAYLAQVCVTMGEYGYAQQCLDKIMFTNSTYKLPLTIKDIITRLKSNGIKLPPLPKGTKLAMRK